MWNRLQRIFRVAKSYDDEEPGILVNPHPTATAYIWTFCDTVDRRRTPHIVRLKLIKIVDENRSGSYDRSIYRCVECGQYYLYSYNCASDWTSHGDREFGQHVWEPVTAEEMLHIRKTHDFNLSPRDQLRFGS